MDPYDTIHQYYFLHSSPPRIDQHSVRVAQRLHQHFVGRATEHQTVISFFPYGQHTEVYERPVRPHNQVLRSPAGIGRNFHGAPQFGPEYLGFQSSRFETPPLTPGFRRAPSLTAANSLIRTWADDVTMASSYQQGMHSGYFTTAGTSGRTDYISRGVVSLAPMAAMEADVAERNTYYPALSTNGSGPSGSEQVEPSGQLGRYSQPTTENEETAFVQAARAAAAARNQAMAAAAVAASNQYRRGQELPNPALPEAGRVNQCIDPQLLLTGNAQSVESQARAAPINSGVRWNSNDGQPSGPIAPADHGMDSMFMAQYPVSSSGCDNAIDESADNNGSNTTIEMMTESSHQMTAGLSTSSLVVPESRALTVTAPATSGGFGSWPRNQVIPVHGEVEGGRSFLPPGSTTLGQTDLDSDIGRHSSESSKGNSVPKLGVFLPHPARESIRDKNRQSLVPKRGRPQKHLIKTPPAPTQKKRLIDLDVDSGDDLDAGKDSQSSDGLTTADIIGSSGATESRFGNESSTSLVPCSASHNRFNGSSVASFESGGVSANRFGGRTTAGPASSDTSSNYHSGGPAASNLPSWLSSESTSSLGSIVTFGPGTSDDSPATVPGFGRGFHSQYRDDRVESFGFGNGRYNRIHETGSQHSLGQDDGTTEDLGQSTAIFRQMQSDYDHARENGQIRLPPPRPPTRVARRSVAQYDLPPVNWQPPSTYQEGHCQNLSAVPPSMRIPLATFEGGDFMRMRQEEQATMGTPQMNHFGTGDLPSARFYEVSEVQNHQQVNVQQAHVQQALAQSLQPMQTPRMLAQPLLPVQMPHMKVQSQRLAEAQVQAQLARAHELARAQQVAEAHRLAQAHQLAQSPQAPPSFEPRRTNTLPQQESSVTPMQTGSSQYTRLDGTGLRNYATVLREMDQAAASRLQSVQARTASQMSWANDDFYEDFNMSINQPVQAAQQPTIAMHQRQKISMNHQRPMSLEPQLPHLETFAGYEQARQRLMTVYQHQEPDAAQPHLSATAQPWQTYTSGAFPMIGPTCQTAESVAFGIAARVSSSINDALPGTRGSLPTTGANERGIATRSGGFGTIGGHRVSAIGSRPSWDLELSQATIARDGDAWTHQTANQ